jgi:hypothetical protein
MTALLWQKKFRRAASRKRNKRVAVGIRCSIGIAIFLEASTALVQRTILFARAMIASGDGDEASGISKTVSRLGCAAIAAGAC